MPEATGNWSEVIVAGHRCLCYEPPELSKNLQTVLYLHDLAENESLKQASFQCQFDRHGLRLLAPNTGPAWWSNRVCPEFDAHQTAETYLLDQVLPWLSRHWGCEPGQLALLGIGMGGQGALRMAYKHPNRFPVVAAIRPAIDFQIRMEEGDPILARMYRDVEDARQDTATLHIHPLNWPRQQWFCCDPADLRWYDSVDRLRMKLYSLGIPFESDLQTGGAETSANRMHHPETAPEATTDQWDYIERMATPAIDFLVAALERERLRVV